MNLIKNIEFVEQNEVDDTKPKMLFVNDEGFIMMTYEM